MRTAATVAVLALAVLLAGCTGQQPQPGADAGGDGADAVSCDQVSGETHTVTYASSGFSPRQLTVQRCDTVVWESQGPDMWVGSDDHPVHAGYDGTSLRQHCSSGSSDTFDQCSRGDTYRFMFTKTGEWGYHNHVNSVHTGTVVVE